MQITKEQLLKMAQEQSILQKLIIRESGSRERTIEDIELSLVEEILEWNKERGEEFSHKTWKKKKFDKEKHDLEFIDILFFALEMFNISKMDTIKIGENFIKKDIFFQDIEQNLISTVSFKDCGVEFVVDNLVNLLIITAEKFNINIVETFYKKLKINYSRFGYDYDIETGEAVKNIFKGHHNNASVICPYCNEICEDENDGEYCDGESHIIACESCDKEFSYDVNVDITFNTDKIIKCWQCKFYDNENYYCSEENDEWDCDEDACDKFKE